MPAARRLALTAFSPSCLAGGRRRSRSAQTGGARPVAYINPDTGKETENPGVAAGSGCESPVRPTPWHSGTRASAQASARRRLPVLRRRAGRREGGLRGDRRRCRRRLPGRRPGGAQGCGEDREPLRPGRVREANSEYHVRVVSATAGVQTVTFCADPEGNGCADASDVSTCASRGAHRRVGSRRVGPARSAVSRASSPAALLAAAVAAGAACGGGTALSRAVSIPLGGPWRERGTGAAADRRGRCPRPVPGPWRPRRHRRRRPPWPGPSAGVQPADGPVVLSAAGLGRARSRSRRRPSDPTGRWRSPRPRTGSAGGRPGRVRVSRVRPSSSATSTWTAARAPSPVSAARRRARSSWWAAGTRPSASGSPASRATRRRTSRRRSVYRPTAASELRLITWGIASTGAPGSYEDNVVVRAVRA